MAEAIKHSYGPPSCLNEEFLQNALRDGLGRGNLVIAEYTIQNATNVGDNFLSRMFRAKTVIKEDDKEPEELFLIIKSMPKGEYVEEFIHNMQFFAKEGKMMKYTLPMMSKILKEAALPQLFADTYYIQDPPDNLMILEDLSQEGFRTADRLEGLDLPHSLLALQGLATFHAASLAAIERDPEIKERHSLLYWCQKNFDMFEQNTNEVFDVMCSWSDLSSELRDKLKLFQKNDGIKVMFEACNRRESEFNVLTHGDSWTNNFMFRYSGQSPVAVKMVDFQISAYNNPVSDLLYFIMSSPQHDIRLNNIDLFLRTYHQKLVEVCARINYNLNFSFGDLRQSFLERLPYGLLVGIMVYPFTTAPASEAKELDDFFKQQKETPTPNEQFLTLKFQLGMKPMLKYFYDNGVFDL